MTDEPTLERLNRRLAEIQDELLALGEDEFAAKHALKSEQDELRLIAAEFRQDSDSHRSTDDLRAELKERRAALEYVRQEMPSVSKTAASGVFDGLVDIVRLGDRFKDAHDVEKLIQRISRLETILQERSDG